MVIALNLPMVLALYVVIVGGQALLRAAQNLLNAKILRRFIRKLRMETYQGCRMPNGNFSCATAGRILTMS